MPTPIPTTMPHLDHAPRRRRGRRARCRRRGTCRPSPARRWRCASSDEREEQVHLHRDLVRGDVVVAEPRGDGAGDEEREQQRPGAHHEPAADRPRCRGSRPRRAAPTRRPDGPRARSPTTYAAAAPSCASTVPHAEPASPRSSAVDEHDLEQQVHHVRGDRDHERRARVLHAAQVPGTGEREEQQRARRGC